MAEHGDQRTDLETVLKDLNSFILREMDEENMCHVISERLGLSGRQLDIMTKAFMEGNGKIPPHLDWVVAEHDLKSKNLYNEEYELTKEDWLEAYGERHGFEDKAKADEPINLQRADSRYDIIIKPTARGVGALDVILTHTFESSFARVVNELSEIAKQIYFLPGDEVYEYGKGGGETIAKPGEGRTTYENLSARFKRKFDKNRLSVEGVSIKELVTDVDSPQIGKQLADNAQYGVCFDFDDGIKITVHQKQDLQTRSQ